MELTTIRLEISEQVATITMNRPDQLNALNVEMLNELVDTFEQVSLDESVRAVLLTGEGRGFCAGADVKGADELALLRTERPERKDVLKMITRLILAIRQTPKPVIAGLNGVAAGSGGNIALACDIIVASEKARYAQNFTNIGLMPDGGGTFFLPRAVGYHRAIEHFLTGELLSAEQALQLGIYNRVVPPDQLKTAAWELARDLAQRPTQALAATKAVMNREIIPRLRAALEDEDRNQRRMFASDDAREGMTAFGEKRKPVFKGK